MTDNPPVGDEVRLTFRALPDDVPPAIRIRRLLKHALRSLGLKCVRVEGAAPEVTENPGPYR